MRTSRSRGPGEDRDRIVAVRGCLLCDDADVVRRLAVDGEGIAYKSWLDVCADVRAGRLEVLLDGAGQPAPLHLVCPHRRQFSPAIRQLHALLESRCGALVAELQARVPVHADEALALQALAPDFVDMTPPPGRGQGPQGALAASRAFRAAVPDLRCEVEQMIVAGDRVVVHLRFRGHFTGTFQDIQGRGRAVDFVATDIYRIEDGRIAANWRVEDNLALMRQLGAP